MIEQNMIDDVRTAKIWVDSRLETMEELGQRLREIERAYLNRTDQFTALPNERPESVRQAIELAVVEPGRELLNDSRVSFPELSTGGHRA